MYGGDKSGEISGMLALYNSTLFRSVNLTAVSICVAIAAPTVPSSTITFSSYPATLFSIDDFYTTSNGLVVQETTIECLNAALYEHVRAEGTVLTWVRAMVATRLATDARHWTNVFRKFNSGTYVSSASVARSGTTTNGWWSTTSASRPAGRCPRRVCWSCSSKCPATLSSAT